MGMAMAAVAAASSGGGGGGGGGPALALSVSLNPLNVSRGAAVGGHVGPMTAIPSGGSGSYSFAWTVVAPDAVYPLTINSPAAATTDFNFDPVEPGDIASATVRCTVTDTVTAAQGYADGGVTFVNNSAASSGGGIGRFPSQ